MTQRYSQMLKEMVESYYNLPLDEVLEEAIRRHSDETSLQYVCLRIAEDFAPAVGKRLDDATISRWCKGEGIDMARTLGAARRVKAEA